jgi:hypothetical protein
VPLELTEELEKITINIAEYELTEEQLHKYRKGRLTSALAQ